MRTTTDELARRITVARGEAPADLVLKGVRFLDPIAGGLVEGDVAIAGDCIVGTCESYEGREEIDGRGLVAVPGFIDAHVHVESSMVTPEEFERCVLPRGTTTAICDPHEIANVLGIEGLRYFLEAAEHLALDLRVALSSCVPATNLETSGAALGAEELLALRGHPKAAGLAEMMNFPGVLARDPEVLAKIAGMEGGHIDGHSPLLRGRDLNAYLSSGVRTDHECTGLDEAREKLRKGMQILIREGSVAKDVEALAALVTERTWPFVAFCTDDRNPLDIAEEGHLDHVLRKAIACGAPPAAVYGAASLGAARGFGLTDRGLIAPGYRADIVLLRDYERCEVEAVVKDGRPVGEETLLHRARPTPPGRLSVHLEPVTKAHFRVPGTVARLPVIGVQDGSILTDRLPPAAPVREGEAVADPERDLLKVCVLERHRRTGNIGRGFVKGFGLKRGALASSVGHDAHNVCVVGASDAEMALAVNRLIELQGGFVVVEGGQVRAELALPIAGLLSDRPAAEVRARLLEIRAAVRDLGCTLREPLLQLAFLPLPVIPHLKLTDLGLVTVAPGEPPRLLTAK